MNAAFSIWEERIAPVFDVASQVVIVPREPGSGDPVQITMACHVPETTIAALLGYHVSVLVCGAISRSFHDAIIARGMTVHSFVTGKQDSVIRAWRDNRLENKRFRMPGCAQASRFMRLGGQGRRTRQRGSESGSSGSPYGALVIPAERTLCRCPACGHAVVHVPGMPCSKQRCPNCHAPMVRA